MYLGLSILVVSISFLCYKHPPTTWLFAGWLKRSSIEDVVRRGKNAPNAIADGTTGEKTDGERKSQSQTGHIPAIVQNDGSDASAKVEQDRKMMPPPPPPSIKKPTSPTTPKATSISSSKSIPSLNLTDTASSSQAMPPPRSSFPAANSAQRASSNISSSSQPRLAAFPALNSAQRASGSTNAPQRLPAPGLMPPPSIPRSSLPNRGPPTTQSSTSSLFPPPTHNSIPSKPSKKVLLTPNHSPLDWARLTSTSTSLNGLPANSPYLRVPPSLLKTMTGRKGKDAWTVLGGKVYNISPYADFHPGGVPELMKGAGRDGTRLFAEVHPWVNWEGMLEGCLVGIAVDEGEGRREGGGALEEMD